MSHIQQDTSNRAPGLAPEIRANQNDINSSAGIGSAAPGEGKAKPGGHNVGSLPGSASGGAFKVDEDGQRHSGAAGLGPHYHTGPSFNDKMHGLKEKLVGGMTKDKDMQERGAERSSGELYVNRAAEDEERQNPLNNPVKGQTGLTGEAGQLNPDDSKGMASKRLGEDRV